MSVPRLVECGLCVGWLHLDYAYGGWGTPSLGAVNPAQGIISCFCFFVCLFFILITLLSLAERDMCALCCAQGCGGGAPEVLEILEVEGKAEVRRITEVSPATAAAAAAVAAAAAKKKEGAGQQPHGGIAAAAGPNKENVQPQQQRAA